MPPGASYKPRPPTCMGCSRDSPNRKIASVGEISFMVISFGRSCSLDAPPPRYTNVSLYWVAQVRRGGPPPGGTYRCGYRADGRYRHLSGRGAATSAGSRADHRDGAQTIRSRRATCESALECCMFFLLMRRRPPRSEVTAGLDTEIH